MKKKNSQPFKTFGILLALSILLAFPMAVLAAEVYPSMPVRLVIPFPPGGGLDNVGRVIVTRLSERLGKSVFMDYRGGAGGVIGADMAAKAKPDGYTLLMISDTHAIQPAIHKVPYDLMKSFVPIAKLVTQPMALAVHSSVPANSVKEFIALAKQKSGKVLFGTAGSGGNIHMMIALFKVMANIDVTTVHFKGAGPNTIDLIGGHTDASFLGIARTLPHVKSGKLKVLATTGLQRSALLPDVPTIAEAGVPGFEATPWYGMLAPAGTPMWIVDKLDKELKAILEMDEIKKQYLAQGMKVEYLGPTEFGQFIERDLAKWVHVVKEANVKLEE